MKKDWLPKVAKNTGLITAGAIIGILFAFALDVGYPIRADTQPAWCQSNALSCWLWEWQTLIGSFFAVGAAYLTIREARRQFLLSRWIEYKKVAEDYMVVKGILRTIHAVLNRAEPVVENLNSYEPNQRIRLKDLVRIDLEETSNIRKEFNPEFFDLYSRYTRQSKILMDQLVEQDKSGAIYAGGVRESYAKLVSSLRDMGQLAQSVTGQGLKFVELNNRTFPKDLHLSLGATRDELSEELALFEERQL